MEDYVKHIEIWAEDEVAAEIMAKIAPLQTKVVNYVTVARRRNRGGAPVTNGSASTPPMGLIGNGGQPADDDDGEV